MGRSLEELMAYADKHPDTELFDNTSRSEMMQYLMRYNEDSFIDWSFGECRFDSIQLPLEIYNNVGICIGFPAADVSIGGMLITDGTYAITIK